MSLNNVINKEWLSPRELELLYGIKKATQAKYRMARKIPYSKIGQFIRYNKEAINQWLANHNVRGGQ
ncbi:MAG: helix-turn-helix domain-containing protein [Campylobacteraceae bacterium]|jgi:predicted DNA-binding transcriptional regulator AlpA|nr:helix-turn-helix domain-containing protein [Campylobacteraceae bacterium]